MAKFIATLTTALLWLQFLALFAVFGPLYAAAWCLPARRRHLFQVVTRCYVRCFLAFARLMLPRTSWRLPWHKAAGLASAVVVCNHLSFLDPLLFIGLLPRAVTIVRPDFFSVPFFGWVIANAGFVSPQRLAEDPATMQHLRLHLRQGGNIFVFPEGTRSRTGELGPFLKGAFYVARQMGSPLELYKVRGTDRVFPPDSPLFDPLAQTTVEVVRLAGLDAATVAGQRNTRALLRRVREVYAAADERTAS